MESGKTQVVSRVAAILNAIALHGAPGARLLDLSQETGIARPTVHRILQELTEAGFVEQRASRRYGLGSALYLLGLSAPSPINDFTGIEKVARRLAEQTGDTVYVAMRRLDGVHYLMRADGSYPIRAEIVGVGETVPLGTTFAGIALLSWHEPEAVEAQLLANERLRRTLKAAEMPDLQDTLTAVRQAIAQVHEHGYYFDQDTVMRGVSGIAAPIPSKTASPYMAVTISAINDRLPPERIEELAPSLLEAARRIGAFIQ
ncbi:IclR family transcriptional regulator [Streptomyces sp. NPDC090493]|uniref:IclR family transcriptional regulator n=1 Tax=Streptomyces sp. NPDC090493 TaxID=3365964 RepID=UPI0037F5E062